ncbi:MAG TPA: toast rack family protein [Bryobacteraceae bacterium]|nr:toast rack family protein [Bryobacteraceae bacterium]
MALKLLFPIAAAALLAGCTFDSEPTGPTKHESQSVDLDKSEMLRVNLKMGAGELKVDGGSPKLVDANFTYNIPSWKPEFRYTNTGVRGDLTIEQPGTSHGRTGNTEYTWELRFNDNVPLDLSAHFGAGEARMNLGTVSLRSVTVEMGVGELRMDLRGKPTRDYNVTVHGGVGEATIYLPQNVGVSANARGGIGGITTRGLHKEGGAYVNDAYQTAHVKINLDISGGVGAINLFAE